MRGQFGKENDVKKTVTADFAALELVEQLVPALHRRATTRTSVLRIRSVVFMNAIAVMLRHP